MHPDDWTPRRGWLIALGLAVGRTAVVAAVYGGIVYGLWPIAPKLPDHWMIWAVEFLLTIVFGWPMGWFVARKLPVRSGLAGASLQWPVNAILAPAIYGAWRVASAFRGETTMAIYAISTGMAVWALAGCVKTLFLEEA